MSQVTQTQNQTIIAPAAPSREQVAVPFAEGSKLQLEFDPNEASISRVDNDLVFSFDNGGQVTITEFFVTGGADLPMLVLADGVEVPSGDIFSALNPDMDLSTAAGPAAASPTSGGTSYDDDAGNLIGGLDKLGTLGTDYWNRSTEVASSDRLLEIPGGSFDVGVETDFGGSIGIVSSLFEDGMGNQHLGDFTPTYGRIIFNFTPTGTTLVDSVLLTGFDAGTQIYFGNPEANPGLVPITISGAGQGVVFTYDELVNLGIYVVPPKDSDHDMEISAQVVLRAESSGQTNTFNGSFTFVVDAVADKPELADESFGNVELDGSISIAEDAGKQQSYEDGWAKDVLEKEATTSSENVIITVPFTATVTFGDFDVTKGAEDHFALVEKPAGDWTPTGLPYTEITLWVKDGQVVEPGTAGATEKDFYKFEVANGDINPDGTYNLNITFEGSRNDISSDTTITLQTGAMAEEVPTDAETRYDNNTSYTLTQPPVSFEVDTVDSKLELNLGWFSEGGDGAKNTGGASYVPPLAEGTAAGAGEFAKISLNLDNSSANAHGEHITRVEFTYDEERGELFYNGSPLATGSYTIAGTSYDVVVDTATNKVTIDISGSDVTSLDGLGLTFVPTDNFKDTDIDFGYKVTVESSKGATAEFSGNSKVVVDAVADKGTLTDIEADYEGSYTAARPGGTVDISGNLSFPDVEGTESQYLVFNIPQGWSVGGQSGISKNQIDGEFKEIGGEHVLDGGDVVFPISGNADAPEYFIIEILRDSNGDYAGFKVLVADGANNLTEASPSVQTALEALISFTQKPDGSLDYTLGITAPASVSGDTTGAVYAKPITVVQNPGDKEYDYSNNIAVSGVESTPVKVAVVDSVIAVSAGTAFEDNISAIHTNDGTQTSIPSNGAAISVTGLNTGAAAGDNETIESITFTFDALQIGGADVASGYIHYNGVNYNGTLTGGVFSVTIVNYNPSLPTYFVPGNNNSDADVTLGYQMTVKDPSSGATKDFSGSANIVIDAVADKPVVTIKADGTQVDYEGENGGNVPNITAQPGEDVVLHAKVEFNDLDGSENHFILIQAGVSGVNYDGYSINGGSYINLAGVSIENGYYKIPVNVALPYAASFDVALKVNASPTSDTTYTIAVGGLAVEKALVGSGGETDDTNNSSMTTGNVSFEVSPAEGITTSITNTYEDLSSNQHQTLTPNTVAKGKVVFSTNDAEGDEVITKITITYDGDIADIGTVTCPVPGAIINIDTHAVSGGGTETIITITAPSGSNLGKTPSIEFEPKADSDIDFNFDYKVTTLDPESGHIKEDNTGTTKIIVDAVADKPDVTVDTDGTQVDYESERVGGNIVNDNTKAAKPGEVLTVNIKNVEFGDYTDGSEKHYIYFNKTLRDSNNQTVDADGTPGADTVALLVPQTIVITGNGYTQTIVVGTSAATSSITITDAGGHIIGSTYSFTSGEYNLMTTPSTTYSNYNIPVLNEFLKLAGGNVSASFEITAPDVTSDTHYVLKAGGYAKETESDAGSTVNNESLTPKDIHFDVRPVTSTPTIIISLADQQIYENLTKDAHLGDYTKEPGSASEIKLGGIAEGETATITLIFSNKDASGADIDFTTSSVTFNGVNYPVGADGKCTITVEGTANDIDGILTFAPGDNYNSQDIKVEYEVSVTDDASGEVKYWNNTGDTSNNAVVQDNPLTIQVDAVAQKPVFGYEDKTGDGETADDYYGIKADYSAAGGTDAFVRGGKVVLTAEVTFQDYIDGSERHYLLVEAKAGWVAPIKIMLVDASGNPVLDSHGIPVEISTADAIMQPYYDAATGKVMFYRMEIPNEYIELCNGTVRAQIWMQSPDGVGSSESFKIGALASEDAAVLNRDNVEFDTRTGADSNNVSFTINEKEVSASFDKAGAVWLAADGHVSENDTSNAHEGNYQPDGGVTITIGGIAEDEITDFQFTNYDPSKGTITFNGIEIRADGTPVDAGGNPITILHPGDKFVFTPAENYSDADVKLTYNATVTDPNSGDTYGINNGNVGIVVDAVAQKPGSVTAVDPADGDSIFLMEHIVKLAENGEKQTILVKATATFSDYDDGDPSLTSDDSELHFLLVEVKPNMFISDASGEKINYDIYYATDGARYYKIPVSNADIKAGNGSITLNDLYITMYSRKLGYGHEEDTVKIGALAEEKNLSGAERDYHNNTSEFLDGTSITIIQDWPAGDIIWVDPAYENNTKDAHLDDGDPSNGMHPLETPHQGGHITFDNDAVEAVLTWDASKGSIVVNGVVNNTGSITLTGEDLKNAYFQPNKNYSDTDVDLGYKVTLSGGAEHTGTFPVIVDAVAQMPEDLTISYNYGDDGMGNAWSAVGSAGNGGNEGIATITVGGYFADDNDPTNNGFADTSENHYALLEKKDGYKIVDASGNELAPEEIYLNGVTWYKIPIASGESSVDVNIKILNPYGSSYSIKTGLMAEEKAFGELGNFEGDSSNNIALNLTGEAVIKISTVDTTVAIDVASEMYENDVLAIDVTAFNVGANDKFLSFELNFDADKGEMVFSFPSPNPYVLGTDYTIVGGKLTISSESMMNALKNNVVTLGYKTNEYADDDFAISWSTKAQDMLSGDTASTSGSQIVVVDAVAQAPDVADQKFFVDGTHEAASSGGTATATATVTFKDLDGSSKHYVVLEQDGIWVCKSVVINGVEYSETSTPTLLTIFSENGTPYYALDVTEMFSPADKAANTGSLDVTFNLDAPVRTGDLTQPNQGDVDSQLKIGGISIEETTGAGSDREISLGNNWAEGLQDGTFIPASMAVVETSKVEIWNTTTLIEDDNTGAVLKLSDTYEADEKITSVEFSVTQEGAAEGTVIGTIWYDGVAYEVVATSVTENGITSIKGVASINFGLAGFDSTAEFRFVAANASGNFNHNSNDIQVSTKSTVVDVKSGESKTFEDSHTINVQATADEATSIEVTQPSYGGNQAVGANQSVTFSVSAKFADTDGSEQHYILVEKQPGWSGSYSTVTTGGVEYFKILVPSTSANPTVTITLTTPAGAVDGDISLVVGGMVIDGSSTKYTLEGDSVNIAIGAVETTDVMANSPVINEGGVAVLNLSIDGNNEIISKVVFNAPAHGGIWYDGVLQSVSGGIITINNFDASKELKYVPAEHASGDVSFAFTATVKDNASGITKVFNGTATVQITPVPDTPDALDSDVALLTTGFLGVELQATFADNDGSEEHFFLVCLPAGVNAPAGWLVESDAYLLSQSGLSGSVYRVEADSFGKASFEVSLDGAYAGESVVYKAVSSELVSGNHEYSFSTPSSAVVVSSAFTAGDDTIIGSMDNEILFGGDGNDFIDGTAGNNIIYGGDGNDTIYGGVGNDTIYANSGNNTIYGGLGDDHLYSGSGADTFVWDSASFGGSDTIHGFSYEKGDKVCVGLVADDSTVLNLHDILENNGNALDEYLSKIIEDAEVGDDGITLKVSSAGQAEQSIFINMEGALPDYASYDNFKSAYHSATDEDAARMLQDLLVKMTC